MNLTFEQFLNFTLEDLSDLIREHREVELERLKGENAAMRAVRDLALALAGHDPSEPPPLPRQCDVVLDLFNGHPLETAEIYRLLPDHPRNSIRSTLYGHVKFNRLRRLRDGVYEKVYEEAT